MFFSVCFCLFIFTTICFHVFTAYWLQVWVSMEEGAERGRSTLWGGEACTGGSADGDRMWLVVWLMSRGVAERERKKIRLMYLDDKRPRGREKGERKKKERHTGDNGRRHGLYGSFHLVLSSLLCYHGLVFVSYCPHPFYPNPCRLRST